MKAMRQDALNKWNSLTDSQKSEIYGLQEKMAALKKQMIDKYSEYGVIDNDAAEKIKERIDTRMNKMKTSGKAPFMFGVKGK
jgi:hypothetical protein